MRRCFDSHLHRFRAVIGPGKHLNRRAELPRKRLPRSVTSLFQG